MEMYHDYNEPAETTVCQEVAAPQEVTTETVPQENRRNVITLKKPYTFEKKEYTEIDLSGLDKLTIQDAIDAQRKLFGERETASVVLCETTTAFAREIAAKATGLPIEFFKFAPRGLSKQIAAAIQDHVSVDQSMKNQVMKLKAPYQFKGTTVEEIELFGGTTVEEIDLSGVADLNSLDESEAENRLVREGFVITDNSTNYLYACCIASMATKYPESFFTGLPLAELVKLRTAVNDAGFFE